MQTKEVVSIATETMWKYFAQLLPFSRLPASLALLSLACIEKLREEGHFYSQNLAEQPFHQIFHQLSVLLPYFGQGFEQSLLIPFTFHSLDAVKHGG